mgnify:CR=1 FL=1
MKHKKNLRCVGCGKGVYGEYGGYKFPQCKVCYEKNIQSVNNPQYGKYLFFIVLFGLFLRLIFFAGIGTSDDLAYTDYASKASMGKDFIKDSSLIKIWSEEFFIAILDKIQTIN